MARTRFFPFYRLFSFPFSHFESKSRQFFEGTSLFSAPNFNFSSLFPVFTHASGTSSRDPTLYYRHTPSLAQREGFFISCFPHSSLPPPPSSPDLLPFRPTIPPPSSLPPHFFSHSSPLFHLPPQLTHERAHPRASRAYAYARTSPHVRRFSFITFTASPTLRNPLCNNTLRVKKNEKSLHRTHNYLKIIILPQTPDFIRRKLHLITAVNPTIPTVNQKTKSLHPLCAVPQPFAAYR